MPKTALDKLVDVVTELADPEGASRVAIQKRMTTKYPEVKANFLKKALADGLKKGKLIPGTSSSRFAVAGQVLEAVERPQVTKTIIKEGTGPECAEGDTVDMAYVGKLTDGSVFDKASHFTFQIKGGDVIKGWDQGVVGMKVGEKARLVVPPSLGYGKRGALPEIPPDSTLDFTITLNKIM